MVTSEMIQRSTKRLFDIVIAGLVLLLVFPLLVVVLILVRLFLGGPVFFSQERPGYKGRVFIIKKIRTMTDERGSDGGLLPDEQRLKGFGKLVRSLSLDELPQLWNVIKGDMSLVGPRPLLVQYLPLYTEEERRRHDVPPGITGWAQVNGRNNLSWKEKFKLDVWYVDNWSLFLDFKILCLTALAVLLKRGVSKDGHVTTVAYDGTN